MDDIWSPPLFLGAAVTGTLSHSLIFRHGEWDLFAVRILTWTLLLVVSVFSAGRIYSQQNQEFRNRTFVFAVLLLSNAAVGFFTSLLVYRGFLHRLRKFPGPVLARFSNLYVTTLSAKNLRLYEEVQALHNKYGRVVRIGPSELSINLPSALHAIHGPGTKCTKGPWYNVLQPMVSLQMIRDRPEHARRRKVWDRGFGAKALRDYEPRVVKYTDKLASKIKQYQGQKLDIALWFNFYSFDVMGDLAFGESFSMLDTGIKHYFMTELHQTMKLNGLFSHLVWLFPLFKQTPLLNSGYLRFTSWLKATVDKRRQMKLDVPDVFSWLLAEHEKDNHSPTKQQEIDLIGDAYLIAVAGSDTTAATLSCLFFELLQNPTVLQTLVAEIDGFYETHGEVNAVDLGKLDFLNAAISESLRLHPPVPSGLQRMTPPEGILIDGTFIPGDTIVQIPSYTAYRDASFFSRPEEYLPTRWTTETHLVLNNNCFAPFSIGHSSCIGRHLGLMEVRHVVARILRSFTLTLAPGYDPRQFTKNEKDTFTLALGELDVIFHERV